MLQPIPAVIDCMSAAVHVIAPHEGIEAARDLMDRYEIRHLPVVRGEDLVGIVSDRDLRRTAGLPGVDAEHLTVEDVMAPNPRTIGPEMPIHAAIREMIKFKIGSVVVVNGGGIMGVVTTTDALATLVDLLEGKLPRPDIENEVDGPNRPGMRQGAP